MIEKGKLAERPLSVYPAPYYPDVYAKYSRPKWFNWAVRCVLYPLFAMFLLGAGTKLQLLHFVVFPKFAEIAWPLCCATGSGIGLWWFIRRQKSRKPAKRGFRKAYAIFLEFIVLLVFPCIVIGLTFAEGLPAAFALVARFESNILLTVNDPTYEDGYKHVCRHGVVVDGFWMDKLCDVPESLRRTLHPGQKITVHGYGTSWGIFWDRIETLQ